MTRVFLMLAASLSAFGGALLAGYSFLLRPLERDIQAQADELDRTNAALAARRDLANNDMSAVLENLAGSRARLQSALARTPDGVALLEVVESNDVLVGNIPLSAVDRVKASITDGEAESNGSSILFRFKRQLVP